MQDERTGAEAPNIEWVGDRCIQHTDRPLDLGERDRVLYLRLNLKAQRRRTPPGVVGKLPPCPFVEPEQMHDLTPAKWEALLAELQTRVPTCQEARHLGSSVKECVCSRLGVTFNRHGRCMDCPSLVGRKRTTYMRKLILDVEDSM